jgi:hypothetical protein
MMHGKAVFTGWTCVSGPAAFVDWLVDRGTAVSYRTFASNVDLSDFKAEYRRLGISLAKDDQITWLRSELLDGSTVWVMQYSGIEHLFARPDQDWWYTRSAIQDVTDLLEDGGWPNNWTWEEIEAALASVAEEGAQRNPSMRDDALRFLGSLKPGDVLDFGRKQFTVWRATGARVLVTQSGTAGKKLSHVEPVVLTDDECIFGVLEVSAGSGDPLGKPPVATRALHDIEVTEG